jgi:putative transposase
MFPQERRANVSGCMRTHCGNGLTMERLSIFEQGADSVDTTLTHTCADMDQALSFVTAASQAPSSETTSQDKSASCKSGSHKRKSSKTAEAASTSSAKVCVPYWSERCAEISSGLWLPTETVYAASASISFASSSNGTAAKSWFSTTRKQAPTKSLSTISYLSSTSSLAVSTDVAITRARRNRLTPTPEQRRLFKSWTGCARYAFNRAVEHLRKPGTKANWKEIKGPILSALPDWCKETPYQVKSLAIEDACLAVSAAKRKFRETGDICEVSFKTKRDPRQSINIPGSAIKPEGIYHSISGAGLRYSESLPEKRVGKNSKSGVATMADGRLLLENGRWYLCVPETITVPKPENQGRIVAIDPGIRAFATFYSPAECGQIASGDYSRLVRLATHLDNLLSRLDRKRKENNVGSRRRQDMRKAAARMRAKFKDLVDELHWKTIRFLLSNFDVILLPTFETSQMVSKAKRKIRAKSVRSMLTLSHYRFAQRIEWKAKALGKTVLRVDEAYTSKTASWTGEIINNLGGAKRIKSGGEVVNRDINGARGIFLRALGDHPTLFNVESVQC